MKRSFALLALLALLLMAGCSAQPSPSANQPGRTDAPAQSGPSQPAPSYVSREAAVAVALNGSTEAQLGNAQFVEQYRYETPVDGVKFKPVWVIDLVTKQTLAPRSRVLVDAVTGKVLMVSDPPSGQ